MTDLTREQLDELERKHKLDAFAWGEVTRLHSGAANLAYTAAHKEVKHHAFANLEALIRMARESLDLKEVKRNWTSVKDELPANQVEVLAYYRNNYEKHRRIRAVYARKFAVEDCGFEGDADYDEENDTYYWPEGWYEFNEHEDTHWQVDEEVTHWMPLPEPPDEHDE